MGERGREGDVRKVLESLTSFMLSEIEIFPPFSFPSSGKWKIRVHFQFSHEENGILRVNFYKKLLKMANFLQKWQHF